jgi:hypothetical protein
MGPFGVVSLGVNTPKVTAHSQAIRLTANGARINYDLSGYFSINTAIWIKGRQLSICHPLSEIGSFES